MPAIPGITGIAIFIRPVSAEADKHIFTMVVWMHIAEAPAIPKVVTYPDIETRLDIHTAEIVKGVKIPVFIARPIPPTMWKVIVNYIV